MKVLSLIRQLILLDLPVQGSQPDIQKPGGFRFVAPGMIQHPLDMQLFDTGEIKGG
jgi:hypothetical protein